MLTQKQHDQVTGLLDQLVEISIWQDAQSKAKDPSKNPGESFMTNKLKIIRDTLKNEHR
mgnify:FL=1